MPIWYTFCVYARAHTRTLKVINRLHESIFIFGVGFALSFQDDGQCESLNTWNGNSRTPRFFYIFTDCMESTVTNNNTIMIRKSEISLLKANLLGLLLIVVVAGVLIPLFNWIHPEKFITNLDNTLFYKGIVHLVELMPDTISTTSSMIIGGMMGGLFGFVYGTFLFGVLLMIPHELIHGLTAMVVGKAKWKDLKFGMMWKKCAAYCHCGVPLTVAQYRWVTLMPLILLGIIPSILSFILGNSLMLLYGMIGITVAIGDIWIAWLLRKEDGSVKVYDHPSTAGYFLFDTDEEFEEIKRSI